MALVLADDISIGEAPLSVRASATQPLRVITAEVGSAKSLCVERLMQESIRNARRDNDAPIPVWLSARDAHTNLAEAIEASASRIGQVNQCGAFVVVDGADEVGGGTAGLLLSQARAAVNTWPNTEIVIASRPVTALSNIDVGPLFGASD